MVDDAEFARRIRMVRAYLGLTLVQAGELFGISASQLSARENADEKGTRLREDSRLFMATIYAREAGWPIEVFTDDPMPPLPHPEPLLGDDDLDSADVVDLVEGDDGEDAAHG